MDPPSAHQVHCFAVCIAVPRHQVLIGVHHPDLVAAVGLGAQPSCKSCDERLAAATGHLGYDVCAITKLVHRKERRHHLELLELFAKRPFEAAFQTENFVLEDLEFVHVERGLPARVCFDD